MNIYLISMSEEGIIISIIYISKNKLSRYLLILVIVIATISIFPIPIKNVAGDVVSVLVSNSRLKPIYEVDTDEKKVAISFDATWGSTRTPQLLAILDKHKIKTTFFLTNIWVKKYPQIAKEIADAGHEIGLHTVSHPNLTELPIDKIKVELQDNAKLIKKVTGQEPILFRPPFGAYNNKVIQTIIDSNYIPIQWSVDSLDWKEISAQDIYQRVTTKIKPGSIVLFHNDGANTPQALEAILNYLNEEGYHIIPVSELVYKENYFIDNNGKQKINK